MGAGTWTQTTRLGEGRSPEPGQRLAQRDVPVEVLPVERLRVGRLGVLDGETVHQASSLVCGQVFATSVRTSYVATGLSSWLVTTASQRTSP
jgi:hypothetical protein